MADELKRLIGELNSLQRSVTKFDSQFVAAEPIELTSLTDALQRIDPIWERNWTVVQIHGTQLPQVAVIKAQKQVECSGNRNIVPRASRLRSSSF